MLQSRRPSARVEVRTDARHSFVVASAAFAEGEAILDINGDLTRTPSRYSLQVDDGLHIELPPTIAPDAPDVALRYPWRYLNHACEPSAVLRDRTIVALRPIAVGEEVTIDYDATEYEMAEPFACHCGMCGGREIGGFARLSPEERARRAPLLAPHLKRLLD